MQVLGAVQHITKKVSQEATIYVYFSFNLILIDDWRYLEVQAFYEVHVVKRLRSSGLKYGVDRFCIRLNGDRMFCYLHRTVVLKPSQFIQVAASQIYCFLNVILMPKYYILYATVHIPFLKISKHSIKQE